MNTIKRETVRNTYFRGFCDLLNSVEKETQDECHSCNRSLLQKFYVVLPHPTQPILGSNYGIYWSKVCKDSKTVSSS